MNGIDPSGTIGIPESAHNLWAHFNGDFKATDVKAFNGTIDGRIVWSGSTSFTYTKARSPTSVRFPWPGMYGKVYVAYEGLNAPCVRWVQFVTILLGYSTKSDSTPQYLEENYNFPYQENPEGGYYWRTTSKSTDLKWYVDVPPGSTSPVYTDYGFGRQYAYPYPMGAYGASYFWDQPDVSSKVLKQIRRAYGDQNQLPGLDQIKGWNAVHAWTIFDDYAVYDGKVFGEVVWRDYARWDKPTFTFIVNKCALLETLWVKRRGTHILTHISIL